MSFTDQEGDFFKFLQRLIWITLNEHGENFLHVISYSVFIVKVSCCAKDAVQLLLLLVPFHQVLHDLADLDIGWTNHWVLRDVRCWLILILF